MNTIQTARQVIEHQRKEAKKEYDSKLLQLRGMEAKVQEICTHADTTASFSNDLGKYKTCDDCGKVIYDN
jgi:hypothetical protein